MARRKRKATETRPQAVLVAESVVTGPAIAPASTGVHKWLLAGMTALLAARPLFPSESAATHGDGLIVVMLWLALAVFWLLGAVGRPTFTVRFGWTDAAVLALVGWTGVSAIWAVGHGSPRPALNMFWEWVGLGLCFLMARQLVDTEREARAIVAVMIALAVALAGYGLYQRVFEFPQTRAEYAADPDLAMRNARLWFPPGSPERTLFESRLENQEPLATFALTNSLAAFLAPWLIMLVGVGISTVRSRKRWIGILACGALIAACLALTKSRSGYIAFGVGLLLLGLVERRRTARIGWKTPASVAAAAAIVAIVLATSGLGGDLLGRATKSFGYRVQYWQSSLAMIADHPIVGCGPGNFQNAYTQYKLPEASEEVADPHNFLLEIWSTAGTPAALAFAAVLGCFGFAGVKRRAEVESLQSESLSDGWRFVLAGGAFGFLLSVPLGMMGAAPSSLVALALGLPLAIVAVWFLRDWIRAGQLPWRWAAIGVVVLLVDLLAAGGIGMPGVAHTLWLLLAVGLCGKSLRACRPWVAMATLLAVIAAAVACYCTAYHPVLVCQGEMYRAERQPDEAVEHLQAAAAADPWAAEPWRRLAAEAFDRWQREPDEATFECFRHAGDKALALAPNSASTWFTVGDWYLRASAKTDREGQPIVPGASRDAVRAFREAVRLYPNSAVYRAALADALSAAGDEAGFRQEADAALRLDGLTPHSDKKLPENVRHRLVQSLAGAS